MIFLTLTFYITYQFIKGHINIDDKYIDNFEKISLFNIIIATLGHYLKYYAIYNLYILILFYIVLYS